jgi:hypothetical protein
MKAAAWFVPRSIQLRERAPIRRQNPSRIKSATKINPVQGDGFFEFVRAGEVFVE